VSLTYGTADQTITITCTSLAFASSRESTVLTNTSGFDDILVFGQTQTTSVATGFKTLTVYGYGTVGGTTYPDAVTGSDAAITLQNPPNLRPLGVIKLTAANTSYKAGPWSLRACFGGTVPQKWGIVVYNNVGVALSGTANHHAFTYQGVTG